MKKKIIVIFVCCAAVLFGTAARMNYLRVSQEQILLRCEYNFLSRYSESPDGQYALQIHIRRQEEFSDTSYIEGYLLHPQRKDSNENRRIFWQEIDTAAIETFEAEDGSILDNWVNLEWIDSETVRINGIEVDFEKGYDYRTLF